MYQVNDPAAYPLCGHFTFCGLFAEEETLELQL
jgi:hypothetical protein